MRFSSFYRFPDIVRIHFKQKILYTHLYQNYKDSLKSLSWSSTYNQEIRFRVFTQIDDLHHKSIADIGCGLGHFYRYLEKQNIKTQYTGYDIVPSFIKSCIKKNPQAHFENRNILINKPRKDFDYVFSSGIFAFGDKTFFKEMIKTSFSLCRKGYAFNIHQTENKSFFKIDPADVIRFCKTLKPKDIMLHDQYLPDDFTIFVYR